MSFLLCLSVKNYMRHRQLLQWCNGEYNFSHNGWGDSGLSHTWIFTSDCVKLIGSIGGAYKHSCALKPLSILNTGSITTFLPTSFNTCLKWKVKKKVERNEWNCEETFFITIVCFWMWSIKWRCKPGSEISYFGATDLSLQQFWPGGSNGKYRSKHFSKC